MKKPWVRPPGCACDEKLPAKHRCTVMWMRCNERIAYEMRNVGVPQRVRRRGVGSTP